MSTRHQCGLRSALTSGLLWLSLALGGCDPAPPSAADATAAAHSSMTAAQQTQQSQFRATGSALLQELVACNREFKDAIGAFLTETTEPHLTRARAQWQQCHELYRTSTLLSANSASANQRLAEIRYRLGAPVTQLGYIDGTPEYPHSGIVQDAALPLDAESLRRQHGLTSREDVAIGYAAIAYLLWGRHHFDESVPPIQAAALTPASHWSTPGQEQPIAAHPTNRRRVYLRLATDQLVTDSDQLRKLWQGLPPQLDATQFQHWLITQRALLNADDVLTANEWRDALSAALSVTQSSDIETATDTSQKERPQGSR